MSKRRRRRIKRSKQIRSHRNFIRNGIEQLENRVLPGGFLDLLAGAAIVSNLDLLPHEELIPEEAASESVGSLTQTTIVGSSLQSELALPTTDLGSADNGSEPSEPDDNFDIAINSGATTAPLLATSIIDSYFAGNQHTTPSPNLPISQSSPLSTPPRSFSSPISQLGAGVGTGSGQGYNVTGAELPQSRVGDNYASASSMPAWMRGEGESPGSGYASGSATSTATGTTIASSSGSAMATATGTSYASGSASGIATATATVYASGSGSGMSTSTATASASCSASGSASGSPVGYTFTSTGSASMSASGSSAPSGNNENSTVTFGSLGGQSPGKWEVDWGDGSSSVYNPGDTPTHVWTDDAPVDTPSDEFTVTWTYTDQCGRVREPQETKVTISNVKPTAQPKSVSTNADSSVVIDGVGGATDPSPEDQGNLKVVDYDQANVHWGSVGLYDGELKYYPGDLETKLYQGHTVVESFNYRVGDDDTGQSEKAKVTVTVTGTKSHDKYVKWNVDMGLGDKITGALDDLGASLKNLANVNPDLNKPAFGNEGEFNNEVQGAVQGLLGFGAIGELVQGLKGSLGNWAGVTVEGVIDGVVAFYKGYVNQMVDMLLPTFGGFLQDPILMGCNMKGAPVLGPSPPSIGGTVSLSIAYENPGGQFVGTVRTNEGNNEPSELPGVSERYTAIMNVKLSGGLNINVLGTQVSVQVQNAAIFSLEPVAIKCEDGVEQPVVIST
ncbi:MAG: hypothetical protein H6822_20895 [Planctomycetaceae bacterium]|nr:hypothetical protein [Planctomycetales bacterium]MCB9924650.1 hypothetical protein [Planctomycetaceae bacterium]